MTTWQDRAACRGLDADTFYPEHGNTSITSPAVAAARNICRYCPVARECLFEALATDPADDHGIRGGTTKRERSALRRRLAARLQQKAEAAA